MHGGGNRIYGLHMIIHNGLFAECEVIDNFRGLCGPRTRTCKLVFEGPRGQGLSLRTTFNKTVFNQRVKLIYMYMCDENVAGSNDRPDVTPVLRTNEIQLRLRTF